MSDEDFLSVIDRGREYVFNPDLGEGMADLRRLAQLSDDSDQFLAFAEAMESPLACRLQRAQAAVKEEAQREHRRIAER